MALDDDQPLSGAQFARQVGADPETWAARFLDAVTEVPTTLSRVERIAFIAAWFRDAMAAAVKAAHGETWPPADWDEFVRLKRAAVRLGHEARTPEEG